MSRTKAQRIRISKNHFAEPPLSVAHERKLRDALEEWFLDNRFGGLPITVIYHRYIQLDDGTFQMLDQTQMTKALRLFLLRISERLLGRNAVKFGALLPAQFVWEYGEERGLHNHGRVQFPAGLTLDQIQAAADEACSRIEWIDYVRVDKYDHTAWVEYMLKLKSSGSIADHIDWDNSSAR